MTSVFMSGEYGDFNFGDQGMAIASASRLRSYLPDISIIATGNWLKTSVLLPQVHALLPFPRPQALRLQRLRQVLRRAGMRPRVDFQRYYEASFQKDYASNGMGRRLIDEMTQSAFVFDMGHGGINDVFEVILPYFYWLSHRLNKPLFISGKSVGPFSNPEHIKAFRMTLSQAHTIVLRDADVSRQSLLEGIGISDRVRLVEAGDDTLDLEPTEPEWSLLAPDLRHTIVSGNFFAIQWRPVDYTSSFGLEVYEKLAATVLDLSRRFDLVPVFVPTSWEAHPDIQAGIVLEALLPPKARYTIVSRNIGANAPKWVLGRAKFGIGLSYHFHVWLLSQGRPSIGIYANPYYQVKTAGAFKAYMHHGQPTSLTDFMLGEELESIKVIENWTKEDSGRLVETAEQLRRKWHDAFAAFLKDIGLMSS